MVHSRLSSSGAAGRRAGGRRAAVCARPCLALPCWRAAGEQVYWDSGAQAESKGFCKAEVEGNANQTGSFKFWGLKLEALRNFRARSGQVESKRGLWPCVQAAAVAF